jgi:hypothetical protein
LTYFDDGDLPSLPALDRALLVREAARDHTLLEIIIRSQALGSNA